MASRSQDREPGLPADLAMATPAEIRAHNAWSDRNGVPRQVFPQGARGGNRRGRPGAPLPAPPAHGVVDVEDGGGWKRGTWIVNRTEYARRTDGQIRKLRSWNSRTEQWVYRDAGRDYYRHNVQKFIVNIVARAYIPPTSVRNADLGMAFDNGAAADLDESGTASDAPLLRSTYYGRGHTSQIIPLTPENLMPDYGFGGQRFAARLLEMANVGIVQDQDRNQEDIETALRVAVPELLRRLPLVNTVDGLKHKVMFDSALVWVWDESEPITFDEQIFRHVYGETDPVVETLLDRPLLGLPYIDQHMYNRPGLAKIACLDLTDRGGCVVAQIVELVTKRKTVPKAGARKGGGDTRPKIQVPRFTPQQVAAEFDKIFAELYPGEAVLEDEVDCGLVEPQRPYPYEYAGWQEVGVTSKMVALFCERQKIGLTVCYKNTRIFQNDVETKNGNIPSIVYQIWGDHAYFYDDRYAKSGAAQLPVGPSKVTMKTEDLIKVRTKQDEDDILPFSEMVEYSLDNFLDQIAQGMSKTFYCHQKDVRAIKKELEEQDLKLWVGLGSRPELIKSLNLCHKTRKEQKGKEKKVEIRVKVVPEEAELLQSACTAFNMHTDLALVYHGESKSVLTHRMMSTLFVSRRMKIEDSVKQGILEKQAHQCAICGDELKKRFEIDHISPLCQGGSNDPSNLRALCQPCHSEETYKLQQAGTDLSEKSKFHTIESHLSPQLYRDLHCAPKPKEVSYGVFESSKEIRKKICPKKRLDAEAVEKKRLVLGKFQKAMQLRSQAMKTECVKDLLSRHQKPEVVTVETKRLAIPNHVAVLKCIDAVGCRTNALVKRNRGLPVFSPLDEWQPFRLEDLRSADFVYIEVEGRLHDGLFPYTGPRPYAAEVCEYMLERGTVYVHHCIATLTATRHVPPKLFEKNLETLKTVYADALYASQASSPDAYTKGAILSMLGLYNATKQFKYKETQGYYEIDAGGGVRSRRRMPDGSFVFTSYTELVGLFSMAPWGRIALDVEQLRIAQATEFVRRFPAQMSLVGAHVDGVFVFSHDLDQARLLSQIEENLRFEDGSRMFQIKNEPVCKVPTWPQGDSLREHKIELKQVQWEEYQEWEIPDVKYLAQKIREKGGCQITGPPGTGKTLGPIGVRELMKELQKTAPGKHLSMALRHCTAMLMCGKTIAHYLHKFRAKGGAPKKGTIIIIDEWSEVQLHTWVELAQWKLVGVIFIIVGDADGQRKPIFDSWQDAMNTKDIRNSSLIHELCGGLRVRMSVYRRGVDQSLFDLFTSLYCYADDDRRVPEIAEWLVDHFGHTPTARDLCSCYIVVRHKDRIALNHAMNWLWAEHQSEVLYVPCEGEKPGWTMQPQDMLVWKGMELLCYSRRYMKGSPVTGAVYVVESWDAKKITVSLHPDYVGKKLVEAAPAAPTDDAEEDGSDDEALEDLGEAAVDRAAVQREEQGKVIYDLTHRRFSELMRPQFSLVYASIQGRTLKERICLMDLHSSKMTVRDIITAMSRPTKQSDLKVMSYAAQKNFLDVIYERIAGNELDLQAKALEIAARPVSERRLPSRVGR